MNKQTIKAQEWIVRFDGKIKKINSSILIEKKYLSSLNKI
tara:strand:+ start:152 stop:271 length:120 start_codon:yes stop_codon:yes gene_type:complete